MEDLSRMLFRGKSLDTQKWIEGYGIIVMPVTKESFIIHRQGQNLHQHTEVIPETVGQFTGLKDKNGVEIYEGDIVHLGDKNITYTVVWHDTGLRGKQNGASSYVGIEHWKARIEIVGNIHDYPELLK